MKLSKVTTLGCDHCGDVAATSNENGHFFDGQGDTCETCGYPGTASIDEDFGAWWNSSQDVVSRCKLRDCTECV